MLALHGAVIDSWYRVALGRGRADPLRTALEAWAHAAKRAGAHNSLASAFQMLSHSHDLELTPALGSPIPALSVWGVADRSHRGTDRSSSLVGWPGHTTHIEFPDVGHFPELEAPAAFADAVARFVQTYAHVTGTSPPAVGKPRL